mmetsp:Transcript_3945/g.6677  ORF Transcript_3945/g.6677 Transcript_3945/m.6677 type:complete len:592 (+) Transcript_3945:182-1957(+)
MGSGASNIKSAANIEFLANNSAIWEGNDRFLSRELLNGISQKSGGSVGPMGGLGAPAVDPNVARRRSFSKNTKFTLEKDNELPHHTQAFLKNIGIGVDPPSASSPHRSSRVTHNEQKTKLVTHVFECLGALEELVELDHQSNSSDLLSVNETQSVCDRNTNSVGKLVHELVSIYGLCGDSLKVLLESQPEAAGVEDATGRMALHVAVDKHKPWLRLVDTLVAAYPTACKMRDGGGRLPLHIAVDRNNPSVEVVRAVIRGYPEAASKHRGVGRLPLHYAVFYDQPSVEVVKYLLEVFGEGAAVPDVYGRLPLHYAVDRPRPNPAVVRLLLDAYPPAASMRDTTASLPLHIALDHGAVKSVEVVKMLLDSYPESITAPNSSGRMPIHSVLCSPDPDVGVARFLANQHPDAITLESKPGQNDSPIALCEQIGLSVIHRTLLALRPELSPTLLADLNWEARRVAILISVPPPVVAPLDKEESRGVSKPFTVTSAASTTLPASNIVTNSLTDDLNIMTECASRLPPIQQLSTEGGGGVVSSTRDRERERLRGGDEDEHLDDIEWLLNDRKCAVLQKLLAETHNAAPKVWRKIVMYL